MEAGARLTYPKHPRGERLAHQLEYHQIHCDSFGYLSFFLLAEVFITTGPRDRRLFPFLLKFNHVIFFPGCILSDDSCESCLYALYSLLGFDPLLKRNFKIQSSVVCGVFVL